MSKLLATSPFRIQLLVDGEPQPRVCYPRWAAKMTASGFTPDKEGVHTLLARVDTRDGRTVLSNAVTVRFLSPEEVSIPLVGGNVTAPPVIDAEDGQTDLDAQLQGGIPGSSPPSFGIDPPPFTTELPKQEPPAEPAKQSGGNLIPIKYLLWAKP
jgi:hypothetical protein